MINDKNKNYKEQLRSCIRGVIGFALYFILSYSAIIPLKLCGVDYNNLSIGYKQVYLICYNLFTMLVFIFLYRKSLKVNLKDFKANFKTYFHKYFKVWLIALAVMYVSNIFIALLRYKLTGEIGVASNEETIRETLTLAPFYTFISASIYAPVVEELTFRKSLRNVFNNDILFIVVSAFIFGGMHVFTSGMTWFDLLYLIPYCAPGVAFAYILAKSDNIINTISLHFLHNTILMILQIVLMMRGLL